MTGKKNGKFEGYVTAKLEDISRDIKDIKDNYKEQIDKCDGRFCKLESDNTKSKIFSGKVVVLGGLGVVIISAAVGAIMRILIK
jgi:SH3-like domain-containing protein